MDEKRKRGRPKKIETEGEATYYWKNRSRIQKYQRGYYRKNREKMKQRRADYEKRKNSDWKGEVKGFSIEYKPTILHFD
tara:strand:+ start:219 stop:455 length:237 start_codon:yes stop_codon:yes gene_type:complete